MPGLFIAVLAPLVVQNASLSLAAPDGYRNASAEVAKAAGVDETGLIALIKGTPGKADAASISLIASEHHPEAKLDDAKECTAFAEEMRQHQGGSSQTSSIVKGPTGKTCQIVLSYGTRDAVVISTIVRGPKDTWMMTCSMRTKNAAARTQCQRALASVKFK